MSRRRCFFVHVVVVFFALLSSLITEAAPVKITILESAKDTGAVCLDGTAPAYHLEIGSVPQNWIVHLEGGGWCENTEKCVQRKKKDTGSSNNMAKEFGFSGILGNKASGNPDFFNWNRVKVRYCDGASFTGDAVDLANKLFYKGSAVFEAIMDDLMSKGLKDAKQVLFSGCSAGGHAVILHCDAFRDRFPPDVRFKCLSDAGYFINAKDVSGSNAIMQFYSQVVKLHGSEKSLPKACTAQMDPALCFFPQNVAKTMKTQLFLVNAAYDFWQLKNILAPSSADRRGEWSKCKFNLSTCSPTQMKTIQGYRQAFIDSLPVNAGKFIIGCYAHCFMGSLDTWSGPAAPRVANTTISTAVGDWYFERGSKDKIDCAYPCNPRCPKIEESS